MVFDSDDNEYEVSFMEKSSARLTNLPHVANPNGHLALQMVI